MSDENREKKGPEKAFKAGGVRASIWSYSDTTRTGQQFERKKCSLERVYKASDGSWKSTSSFEANDVAKAILVLSKAFAYMHQENGAPSLPGVREEYVADEFPPR